MLKEIISDKNNKEVNTDKTIKELTEDFDNDINIGEIL
jgi:hypothetical protein